MSGMGVMKRLTFVFKKLSMGVFASPVNSWHLPFF